MDHIDFFRKLKVTQLCQRQRRTTLARLVNLAVEIGPGGGKYRFAYCVDRNTFLYVIRTRKASFYVIVDVEHNGPGDLVDNHILSAGYKLSRSIA